MNNHFRDLACFRRLLAFVCCTLLAVFSAARLGAGGATLPDAPTGVVAVAGAAQAVVSFVAPVSDGGAAITGYTATASPGSFASTGTGSPLTVTGLAAETSYTFTVIATNSIGASAASTPSAAVTPGGNWARNYGLSGSMSSFYTTATDAAGNVYAAGNFGCATLTVGTTTLTRIGSNDAMVAKFDPNGAVIWAKSFGGSGSASMYPQSLAVDTAGNTYLAGFYNGASLTTPPLTKAGSSDGFLFKLDSAGELVWVKSYGGSGATTYAYGMAVDAAGNVYLGGNFMWANLTTPALTKIGTSDAFAFKIDPTGTTVWAKNFGGTSVVANGVAVDAAGNVYLGGYFAAGNMTTPALTKTGTIDAFVLKLSSAGAVTWAKNFGGTGASAYGNSIAVDSGGNAYLGGYFKDANLTAPVLTNISTTDAYAIKLDTGGTVTWAKNFGGSGASASATNIRVDSAGKVYLAGTFSGANLTNPALTKLGVTDSFAIKLDASGTAAWSKNFGGSGANVSAKALAVDVAGSIFLAGYFDSYPLTTPVLSKIGYADAYLIKRSYPAIADAYPGAPTFGQITATTATLSGLVASDDQASVTARGFVYAATATNSSPRLGGTGVTRATVSNSYMFATAPTGLTPSNSYSVVTFGTTLAGTSYSSTSTLKTCPGAPTIDSAPGGNGTATLAFTPFAGNGDVPVTNYQYSSDNGSNWTTRSPASTASPATISGLTNGTTYQIKLRAVNSSGGGTASTAVSVTPYTVAGAPSITSATPGNTTASIAFSAPASNGSSAITNYELSTDNGTSWTACSPATTASPIVVSGLVNNTTYQVKLRAVNAAGAGATSGAASVTPFDVPGAPTITSATAGNSVAFIVFAAPASDGGSVVTNYEYSSDNGTTWTARSPASTGNPIMLAGLTNGTTYQVKLRAVNAGGAGEASAAVSVTPLAPVSITAPLAPTIVWTTPGDTTLSVAFSAPVSDGGAAVTNYEYSINNGSTWTARSPAATASPLAIAGLTNDTTYQIKLRAVNSVGAGAASNAVTATPTASPSVNPPGAPTLDSAAAGNGAAYISFTAPANDGGATIANYEYSTDNGATWAVRAPASAASPIVVSGLTNGTAYRIKLRAVNSAGTGAASNALTATPFTVPGAPTITGATPANSALAVAFTAPVNDGAAGISNYEYSTDDGATWTTRSPAATSSPLTIAGLANGTTYQVRLRAVNAAGAGAASAALSATPAVPPSATTPDAPTLDSVAVGDGSVFLIFSSPASDGGAAISNYEYSTNNGAAWTARIPAADTSPLAIAGLTNGTTYSVRLRAVNSAGVGTASNAASATPFTVPGAPSIAGVTPGNATVAVAFSAPASDGGAAIANYAYSTDGGATWTARSPAATASSVTITGLTNGMTYQIKLRAVNAAGAGSASGAVSATPAELTGVTAPGAPTIDTGAAGNGAVFLAFTAPMSDGGAAITNYEYSTNNGTSWTARTPAAVASPMAIAGLVNGTTYAIRLRAVNSAGAGPVSNSVNATPSTVPGAPTSVSALGGNAQAVVSFTAPANNGGAAITSYTATATPGGATASGASSPLTVTGLTNGTSYTFTVTATNPAGTGAASGASLAVTPVMPAPAPTVATPTSVSMTQTSATLGGDVTSEGSAGVTARGVVYAPTATNSSPQLGGTGVTNAAGTGTTGVFTVDVTGLTANTAYSFAAYATSSAGTS